MAKVKVKLLRPLNGQEVGATVSYDKADATRLAGYGAVEIVGDAEEPDAKNEGASAANKAEGASETNKAEAAAPASKAPAGKAAKGK